MRKTPVALGLFPAFSNEANMAMSQNHGTRLPEQVLPGLQHFWAGPQHDF
jgi:hypothetical protein